MSQLQVGDLVRVAKQSTTINSHISMTGLRGFIEGIVGDIATFQELRNDNLGGCGGIPLDCLVKDDSPSLRQLKEERDARVGRLIRENDERVERCEKLRQKYWKQAMEETGVSMEAVEKIFELAAKFDCEWERTSGW